MQILEFIRNIDDMIGRMVAANPAQAYGLLFLIVFAETGLVVTPFLPGDTLLFAVGILSNPAPGQPGFNVWLALLILTIAPICGDTVNYHIGKFMGPRLFKNENSRFFKKENLQKTSEFFEKHGGKAVIFARWIPIVRTFAPFVAGMGAMEYRKFFGYSLLGAFLWVWICVWAGFFFGQIPAVKNNFELAMLAMLLVSGAPMVYETIKHRREVKAAAADLEDKAKAELHI
jgi:membrane-associated protein